MNCFSSIQPVGLIDAASLLDREAGPSSIIAASGCWWAIVTTPPAPHRVRPMPDLSIAERLFAAIEAGDLAGVEALYAPDIVVWHNTDGVAEDRATNLRTLRWVVRNLADRRYEDIRRFAIPNGFVQQHVLCATNPDGRSVAVPACMVVTTDDGLITRIDEYLDSVGAAQLSGG